MGMSLGKRRRCVKKENAVNGKKVDSFCCESVRFRDVGKIGVPYENDAVPVPLFDVPIDLRQKMDRRSFELD